jgi:hypothetical protein
MKHGFDKLLFGLIPGGVFPTCPGSGTVANPGDSAGNESANNHNH